MLKPEPQLSFL